MDFILKKGLELWTEKWYSFWFYYFLNADPLLSLALLSRRTGSIAWPYVYYRTLSDNMRMTETSFFTKLPSHDGKLPSSLLKPFEGHIITEMSNFNLCKDCESTSFASDSTRAAYCMAELISVRCLFSMPSPFSKSLLPPVSSQWRMLSPTEYVSLQP